MHIALGYCLDIGYQYAKYGYGMPRSLPSIYRFITDSKKKISWVVLAISKEKLFGKYKKHFKDFYQEFELADQLYTSDPQFRDLFGFSGLEWANYDFYQTKVGKELGYIHDKAYIELLSPRITNSLKNKSSPNYVDNQFDFLINLPTDKIKPKPLNEELAIYLVMFFMGELVRYRPEYLYKILESKVYWLLQSFVLSCPLKYLRAISSRIINPAINGTFIVKSY